MTRPLLNPALAVSVLGGMIATASLPPHPVSGVPGFSRLPTGPALKSADIPPSPGVYLAAPYACMVRVPAMSDPMMIKTPEQSRSMDNCIKIPGLESTPKR